MHPIRKHFPVPLKVLFSLPSLIGFMRAERGAPSVRIKTNAVEAIINSDAAVARTEERVRQGRDHATLGDGLLRDVKLLLRDTL